jgi:hypothetical protein
MIFFPHALSSFLALARVTSNFTKKDRHLLLLIYKILKKKISKAKWFTKLDVTAAFHKIRIAEGDEWMTSLERVLDFKSKQIYLLAS